MSFLKLLLDATLPPGDTLDELWLIATSGDPVRFRDRISYLPI